MDDQAIVDDLATVWESLTGLCATFDRDTWETATDCPGWSVKDLIAHMAGTESMLLGRPRPDHRPVNAGRLPNALAELNEIEVDYRRPWSAERVWDEFREVTTARLAAVRAMSEEDLSRPTPSPMGTMPYRDFLRMRVFDCWVHEQDIRHAVGLSAVMTGPLARQMVDRMAAALPFVVGKKVAPPDGTSVVFVVTGEAGGAFPIEMAGGRARRCPVLPETPAVRLEMDTEAFIRLACGRGSPQALVDAGRIRIEGDRALGLRIVEQATITP